MVAAPQTVPQRGAAVASFGGVVLTSIRPMQPDAEPIEVAPTSRTVAEEQALRGHAPRPPQQAAPRRGAWGSGLHGRVHARPGLCMGVCGETHNRLGPAGGVGGGRTPPPPVVGVVPPPPVVGVVPPPPPVAEVSVAGGSPATTVTWAGAGGSSEMVLATTTKSTTMTPISPAKIFFAMSFDTRLPQSVRPKPSNQPAENPPILLDSTSYVGTSIGGGAAGSDGGAKPGSEGTPDADPAA